MADTMKAAVKVRAAPGATQVKKVPHPKIGPTEALVRVKIASICGTDLHIYKWDAWARSRMKTPIIFGHECCGEVGQVGESVQGCFS